MSVIGILIGIYGYIFPGNINLMVVELYSTKNYKRLFCILALIIIFESIYCGLSLSFLKELKNNVKLYKSLEAFSLVLIYIMALWMILEKRKSKISTNNTLIRGVFSIVIHPQQIPFWIIMGVLVNKLVLINSVVTFWLFVFFNALGTLFAMLAYMKFANFLLTLFNLNMTHINNFMGIVYLLLILYTIFKTN
jgi:hypothetical protein